MPAKVFSIQILKYFRKILPTVCTLVFFIFMIANIGLMCFLCDSLGNLMSCGCVQHIMMTSIYDDLGVSIFPHGILKPLQLPLNYYNVSISHVPTYPPRCAHVYKSGSIQWNPSIVATIRDQPFGLYRGVATSQGLFYIIDKTCTCMV